MSQLPHTPSTSSTHPRRSKRSHDDAVAQARQPLPHDVRLALRRKTKKDLARILPTQFIEDIDQNLSPFRADALPTHAQTPLLAVIPQNTQHVQQILAYCNSHNIPVTPRGAGTSLSGGSTPLADGIVLSMTRFNRVVDIRPDENLAVVEPGVVNLALNRAAQPHGLFYAPDPSSQAACTIGGNLAENSGGIHCLKYGVTAHNILDAEVVLPSGDVVRTGYGAPEPDSLNLLSLLIGSEGLLGVVTEIIVKLTPSPQHAQTAVASFNDETDAALAVAHVIAEGIVPAGMEMMDKTAAQAVERYLSAGYPPDARAVIVVETDGSHFQANHDMKRLIPILKQHNASVRVAKNEAERQILWDGRKAAFPALAHIAPDYICMDGSIPRHAVADVLQKIRSLSKKYNLPVANVFHAGDGNLHPLILFDSEIPGETLKAEAFGDDVLRVCLQQGGALTGEHGVGLEKRSLMNEAFSHDDLALQNRIKCSFDPNGVMNPGKVFPKLRRCAELGRQHIKHGADPFPHLPRF